MARPVAKTVTDFEQAEKSGESTEGKKNQRELIVEMDSVGLYTVRQSGGGKIPDSLQGRFTSISKVNDLIRLHEEGKK